MMVKNIKNEGVRHKIKGVTKVPTTR